MDEERTDAPDFDLTPPPAGADGPDALQLGPADVPAEAATAVGDAFAMRSAKPAAAPPPAKPSKPVTAEANASVVAALMGRPMAKKTPPAAAVAEPSVLSLPSWSEATPPAFEVSQTPVADALLDAPVVAPPPGVGTLPDAGPEVRRRPGVRPPPPTLPPCVPSAPVLPARPAIPVAPVWTAPTPPAPVPVLPKPRAPSPKPSSPVPGPPPPPTGAWWTLPLTFFGIAIVACAILIPVADDTRRDAYELARIEGDVDYFQRQSDVNADFLQRVDTDPTLAERLAQRQLHQTRAGTKLAPLAGPADRFGASPYALTRLDPPPPLPPYQPVQGVLADLFRGGQKPQQMAALGLLLAGAGVMLGGGRRPRVG